MTALSVRAHCGGMSEKNKMCSKLLKNSADLYGIEFQIKEALMLKAFANKFYCFPSFSEFKIHSNKNYSSLQVRCSES